MAALNQDFVTYRGDTVSPIYTVLNSSNIAIDISTVTEIVWEVYPDEDMDLTPIVTKTKTGGQITFVTDGSDGKFQVAVLAADTTPLKGYYFYRAKVTDSTGNVTTTSTGRMQVGLVPTWTYNPAKLATDAVYQVRRLIGDVLYSDQQMQDQEIAWYVSQYGNVWMAASAAARALAAQFSRLVDTVQGELRTLYGQRAKNYMLMAGSLEIQGKVRGTSFVYAGAISQSDKSNQVQDTDRTPPQFNLMIFDNLLPVAPVGQQTPGARMPDMPSVP